MRDIVRLSVQISCSAVVDVALETGWPGRFVVERVWGRRFV